MTRAALDKQPKHISTMFDEVAPRYDRVNTLFTLGMDARWRKKMAQQMKVQPGDVALDLAAGTGVSTVAVHKLTGATVIGADFSRGMLAMGKHRGVPLIAADALELPFADNSFNAVCIAFGLRNVNDPERAFTEINRVLKPGGRCVVLETSMPKNTIIRTIIQTVGFRFTKLIARFASSNSQAYHYLIESVTNWPDAKSLLSMMNRCHYHDAGYVRLCGGAVAIHYGVA